MTQEEMAQLMDVIFRDEIQQLRKAGQKEYAHGDVDDAFNNFKRLASELSISKEKVLLVYARKHWDGIIAHVNGYTSQREDVRGRINDLIVYMFLLRGMIDEDSKLKAEAEVL